MTTFLEALLVYGGILAIVSIPAIVLARRKGRAALGRNFGIAAGAIGLVCAFLAWTSKVLVDQCNAAGNTACVDYGGRGFQIMLVAGYGVVALWTAISLARD